MARQRSISDLQTELQRKRSELARLRAQGSRLAAELEEVNKRIDGLSGGGAATGAAGRRAKAAPRRAKKRPASKRAVRQPAKRATGTPLADYIARALAGSDGMRVRDIEAAVRKAGYRSAAKDFYNIVAATLRDRPEFRRVSRGVYKLKS